MNVLKIFLPAVLLICSSQLNAQKNKKILLVFAHPDDETAIGQVIAKLSKTNKLILLTATDGRYGVREHAGIPAGDSLAAVRKKEIQCSCSKLGIDSNIWLGYHDGMGLITSVKESFRQMRELREKVKAAIDSINPNLIITFGPDGDSGHPDHRVIGDMVTEAILAEGWAERFPLYYLAWTKEQSKSYGGLGYVSDKYQNVKISFTDEEELQYFEALRCYQSQYTKAELDQFIAEDSKDKSNTIFFRKLAVANGLKSEF